MPMLRLQGEAERKQGVYYEVDPEGTPIGLGGMGKVFQGCRVEEATGATRPVAIKFLFDDLPADAIEKSRREASIRLQNDNLVEMLGFIETEGKVVLGERQHHYHVVSELLWGVSLQDVMKGNTKDFEGNEVPYAVELLQEYRQNPLDFSKKIVHTVLLGLIALHNAGYIHRDIDPSNIMITRDRKIKLIDFGIAKKFRDLSANDVSRTKAGVFIGKPQYAAPELVLGDIAHQNQTTDIYAMGILLFQCVTGKVPFEGDMVSVMEQQQKKNMPLRLVKNNLLRDIVKKATQKRREDRYQSSAEMLVAIERLPSPLKESRFNGLKLRKLAFTTTVVLILVGMGVGVYELITYLRQNQEAGEQLTEQRQSEPTAEERLPMEYAKVVVMLKDPAQAKEGFVQLKALSENEHYERATFLWSRLLFKSAEKGAYEKPEYEQMRKNASISIDNEEAHRLLEQAVAEDAKVTNDESRYQLSLDYYDADRRDPSYRRLRTTDNLRRADQLLKEAIDIVQDQQSLADGYNKLRQTIQSRIK